MLVELVGLQYSSTLIVLKCRLPWYFPSKLVCSFQKVTKFTFLPIESLKVPLQPSSSDMVVFCGSCVSIILWGKFTNPG